MSTQTLCLRVYTS